MSRGTFERFTERITRLCEQGAGLERIEEYVIHWLNWVRAGIGGLAKINVKEWIKKHPHPSGYEECGCLFNNASFKHRNIKGNRIPLISY